VSRQSGFSREPAHEATGGRESNRHQVVLRRIPVTLVRHAHRLCGIGAFSASWAGLRDAVECGMWLGRGGILVPQPLVFDCGRPPLQVIVNFVGEAR
jgi:hypothetical protein